MQPLFRLLYLSSSEILISNREPEMTGLTMKG